MTQRCTWILLSISILIFHCVSGETGFPKGPDSNITARPLTSGPLDSEMMYCGRTHIFQGNVIHLYHNGLLNQAQYESVRFGHMKSALFSVVNPDRCTLEICGFNWDSEPMNLGSCQLYSSLNASAPDAIYDGRYQLSSMSCACSEKGESCSEMSCDDRVEHHDWYGYQCGILFREIECQGCSFPPVFLEYGSEILGLNSFTFKSILPRPGCIVNRFVNGILDFDSPRNFTYDHVKPNMEPWYHRDSENFTCTCDEDVIGDMFTTTTTTATSVEQVHKRLILTVLAACGGFFLVGVGAIIVWCIRKEIVRKRTDKGQLPSTRAHQQDGVVNNYKHPQVVWTLPPRSYSNPAYQTDQAQRMPADEGSTMNLQNNSEFLANLKKYIDYVVQFSKKEEDFMLPQGSSTRRNDSLLKQFRLVCEPAHEFNRQDFRLGYKLGSGHFGDVYHGVITKSDSQSLEESGGFAETIAAKTLKSNVDEKMVVSFLREIKIFQSVGSHENIVTFVGACCHNGALFILTRFCENGSLKHYLQDVVRFKVVAELMEPPISQDSDDDSYLKSLGCRLSIGNRGEHNCQLDADDLFQLLHWCEQIAHGMQFLNAKKIIHVDLAVRNILLTNDLTVKICDFGLSKLCLEEKDYARSLRMSDFPVNSLAPECTRFTATQQSGRKISLFTDVWAYGCTMWEIFSLGEKPYPGMNLMAIIQMLDRQERLPKPAFAPNLVYDKLLECWSEIPDDRPTFSELQLFFYNAKNQLPYGVAQQLSN